MRFGKPVVRQSGHPVPQEAVLLTATPERAQPKLGHVVPEGAQRATIGRHGVVVEHAVDNLPQPFPLNRDRLVHSPSQLILDLLELRPHAVAPGLALKRKVARS